LKRIAIAFGTLFVASIGACVLLLPERFAVNAPLRQLILGRGIEAPPEPVVARRLRAPEGYHVVRFAEGLGSPRWLRLTPAGDLLVSLPRDGEVRLVLRDSDGDGRSDGVQSLLSGLNRPHGLDLHAGWLYVGETDAVGRIRFDPQARSVEGSFERIVTGIPGGGNHWSRTVRFGPDGLLYVSVGSSCNVCIEADPRRAALLRYQPDGSREEIFATGLRNAVGFDWRPGTGELFATDNGRDLLGDDFPPCELDLVEQGGFYGWPFANGDRMIDPDLGAGRESEVARSISPVHSFRAHNAPLGIAFLRSTAQLEPLRGAALVALHGSWNRTRKDGYKVVSLHWDAGGSIVERDFLVGFLEDEDVIGRPVDVAEAADGSIYVSDDYAGSIYRVATGAAPAGAEAPVGGERIAAAPGAPPPEVVETRLARGREVFDRYPCAECHDPGRAGENVVPVELRELSRRYDLAGMVRFLAAPTPPMPAFDLSLEERMDLATWLLHSYP
jgi:glucose/arabinose dehydrogenase